MKKLLIITAAAMLLSSCCWIFDISDSYLHADNYMSGNGTTTTTIDKMDIDWISGNVDIRYGEGNTLSWEEEIEKGQTDSHTQMRYWVDGNCLHIHYCESGRWSTSGLLQKKLTITLPKNAIYEQLDIDQVSGNVNADIDAEVMNIETVSGNVTITNLLPAKDIDVETVSGNILLILPEDKGFTLEYESVSGSMHSDIECTRSGDTYTHGDGQTDIDVETVSGSLRVEAYHNN